MSQLAEAWLIHNRICEYFLENLDDQQWEVVIAKAKSVQGQFCHIVNVRLMWIDAIDKGSVPPCPKLTDKATSRSVALSGLSATAHTLASLIEVAVTNNKAIKGFKPSPEAFVGYLISHESTHRGMVELGLRQAGLPISDKISYGLWEWGTRFKEV